MKGLHILLRCLLLFNILSCTLNDSIKLNEMKQDDYNTTCESGILINDTIVFKSTVRINTLNLWEKYYLTYRVTNQFDDKKNKIPDTSYTYDLKLCQKINATNNSWICRYEVTAQQIHFDANITAILNVNLTEKGRDSRVFPRIYDVKNLSGNLKINSVNISMDNCTANIISNEITLQFDCLSPAKPCRIEIKTNDSSKVHYHNDTAIFKRHLKNQDGLQISIKYAPCTFDEQANGIISCIVKGGAELTTPGSTSHIWKDIIGYVIGALVLVVIIVYIVYKIIIKWGSNRSFDQAIYLEHGLGDQHIPLQEINRENEPNSDQSENEDDATNELVPDRREITDDETNEPVPDRSEMTDDGTNEHVPDRSEILDDETKEPVPDRSEMTDDETNEHVPDRSEILDDETNEPVPDRSEMTDNETNELVPDRSEMTDDETNEPVPNRSEMTDDETNEPVSDRSEMTDNETNELVPDRSEMTDDETNEPVSDQSEIIDQRGMTDIEYNDGPHQRDNLGFIWMITSFTLSLLLQQSEPNQSSGTNFQQTYTKQFNDITESDNNQVTSPRVPGNDKVLNNSLDQVGHIEIKMLRLATLTEDNYNKTVRPFFKLNKEYWVKVFLEKVIHIYRGEQNEVFFSIHMTNEMFTDIKNFAQFVLAPIMNNELSNMESLRLLNYYIDQVKRIMLPGSSPIVQEAGNNDFVATGGNMLITNGASFGTSTSFPDQSDSHYSVPGVEEASGGTATLTSERRNSYTVPAIEESSGERSAIAALPGEDEQPTESPS